MEETTSSISILRPFVRRREFLLDVNDGVGRFNFFRYGLSDHALLDQYWMIFVGCREEFYLTVSILAAMSSTMVIFTLGSLAISTRLSSPCIRRNPRINLDNSVVIVAFLLKGAALVHGDWRHGRVMGLLRRAQLSRAIIAFVDMALSALVYLFFFLGLIVLFAAVMVSKLYRVVAILI
jgi:hypothetical protein